jgi:N-acetylneuraminic acid mutarotase
VKRIAKFNGPTPATREQLGAVFHNGYLYLFGGATQQSFNDLRRFDPETSEWTKLSEIN